MSGDARVIEVSRVIDAVPAQVFAFLARPDNHAALDTSGMIRGSADHVRLTAAGAVFVMDMHNEIKGRHQVENHVIVYEPDRALGWAPAEPGHKPAGHTWVWGMRREGDARTVVSLTYDWSAFTHLDMLSHMPVVNREQMYESLNRLAQALAPGLAD